MENFEQALPKNLRHNIRRRRKMIGSPDRLIFSMSRKASELTSDLDVFFDLHQRRQRSKGERGRFFDKRWRESFQEMSLMLLKAGLLRLGMLRIDGHPAACYYNLRMGEREYCYSGGMEPGYARYSPGSLLDYWMISEAIKDGIRTYDFGLGNEAYKFQWANETSHLFEMVRARTRVESLIWEKWNFLHKALYRSRLLKRIYLTTVGRFQN
jgi:CelD/BcsL family acetyltransferase involved in cellulose biosynthesis